MAERVDGPPLCTIAGLVLFGHAPRRLLPQSGVHWMAFEGEAKGYRALDDRLIDGPLVALRVHAASGGREIAGKGVIEGLGCAIKSFRSSRNTTGRNRSFRLRRTA